MSINYRRQSKQKRKLFLQSIEILVQTWMSINIRESVASCNGPRQQRTVLIIVKLLVDIMISPSLFRNSRYRINLVAEKNRSINQPSGFKSFFLNSTSDG